MPKLVNINGTDLPQPSTYVGLTADIVNSARNAKGGLIGTLVRGNVAKVELTWNYLTVEQWATVLSALQNTTAGTSIGKSVTFFNQNTATWETRTMYVSDRTSSGVWLCDNNGRPIGWKGCKLSLIEV